MAWPPRYLHRLAKQVMRGLSSGVSHWTAPRRPQVVAVNQPVFRLGPITPNTRSADVQQRRRSDRRTARCAHISEYHRDALPACGRRGLVRSAPGPRHQVGDSRRRPYSPNAWDASSYHSGRHGSNARFYICVEPCGCRRLLPRFRSRFVGHAAWKHLCESLANRAGEEIAWVGPAGSCRFTRMERRRCLDD
jgi:hypothetical protein